MTIWGDMRGVGVKENPISSIQDWQITIFFENAIYFKFDVLKLKPFWPPFYLFTYLLKLCFEMKMTKKMALYDLFWPFLTNCVFFFQKTEVQMVILK